MHCKAAAFFRGPAHPRAKLSTRRRGPPGPDRSQPGPRDLRGFAAHHVGVLFLDGDFVETLPPGRYAFWKNMA